ncbi:nitrogen regulatory IIA protein [Chryseobacterium sp. ISL-6]|uniref:nitrogen regulatory IIA protein n=1 Tax=Chryseobacterium sp. ISL-6 TaxID=2819143 RepID=UPI001BEAAAFA|nr:nitrogen regulatory IIA protein [Chryseobacterium sp. ISL-6]MBT2621893.1 nitrogen regulatory IIA protein [Chryseobacterium sp. ISL-6]
MKKLRLFIDTCVYRLEERWQKLSSTKQRKFLILFFAGYLLITGFVIMSVWYDAKSANSIEKARIDHIRNPVLKQDTPLRDSSSTHLKINSDERE